MDYAMYARQLREELHQCPEIGFDLPKTLGIVRRELEDMGIPYTQQWGKSSIVATINGDKTGFTIGLRADMDALPIQEANDVPYRSQHEGKMHACGHDAHTAILLAVARQLMAQRDMINCRVMLLFTPAEEYEEPGCKILAENGVMEEVDCCVALHVYPSIDVGTVEINEGDQGANSMGFRAKFYGKTSHASQQQSGVDAVLMAVQAIQAMEVMVAKEFSPTTPRLLNIGSIHGGETNNVICDYVEVYGSARAHEDSISEKLEQRLGQIVEQTAAMAGGRGTFERGKFLPYVKNHPVMVQKLRRVAEKAVGPENVLKGTRTLGGEDFGYLSRQKPCIQFRLGTRPVGCVSAPPLHNDRFDIDPGCFRVGVDMMVGFVMANSSGIEFE